MTGRSRCLSAGEGHWRGALAKGALEVGRLADESEAKEGQAEDLVGGAGVEWVVDEPGDVAAEGPVVGAVLEQVEDGHRAVAVPAAAGHTAGGSGFRV